MTYLICLNANLKVFTCRNSRTVGLCRGHPRRSISSPTDIQTTAACDLVKQTLKLPLNFFLLIAAQALEKQREFYYLNLLNFLLPEILGPSNFNLPHVSNSVVSSSYNQVLKYVSKVKDFFSDTN